jgi:hypothetical protein
MIIVNVLHYNENLATCDSLINVFRRNNVFDVILDII